MVRSIFVVRGKVAVGTLVVFDALLRLDIGKVELAKPWLVLYCAFRQDSFEGGFFVRLLLFVGLLLGADPPQLLHIGCCPLRR